MAKVIIFGQGDHAEQALYYLNNDSEHEVVAFCVTGDQQTSPSIFGLPLLAFEGIEKTHPPDQFRFFAPMSGRYMNRYRKRFYEQIKAKGYQFISYISSKAVVCDNQIGENCIILENSNIQPFTKIGNNVSIWCNTHIGHHSVIEDHCWIGTGVVVSGRCHIGQRCYLASQCIIETTVELGEGTLAGTASYLNRHTEPWGIYTGSPAIRRKLSSRGFKVL